MNLNLIKEYNPNNDPVLELLRISRPRRIPKPYAIIRKKRLPSSRRKLLNSLGLALGKDAVQGNMTLDMMVRQQLGLSTDTPKLQARYTHYLTSQDDQRDEEY